MGVQICGKDLDEQSRCLHYHSPLDIVAIQFKCCTPFFACHLCHNALADHLPEKWEWRDRKQKAIYCGECKNLLSIEEYLKKGDRCPHCHSSFNPGCRNHRSLYFDF